MQEPLETPERALVVIPHPDDGEIGCGGTVAKWISEGAEVYYVLCTDGGKGSNDPEVTSEEISAIREKEQQEAADSLGVRELVMLHYPDGDLEDTHEFRKHIVRAVRRFTPDIVMCPEPYRRNSYWHRDHRITGQVAVDAVFPYARDRLHFIELWKEEGLEPHKAGMVLMWGAESPDTYIDITDSIEAKRQAYLCHQSQIVKRPERDAAEFVKRIGRAAGQQPGFEYAEAFRALHFRR